MNNCSFNSFSVIFPPNIQNYFTLVNFLKLCMRYWTFFSCIWCAMHNKRTYETQAVTSFVCAIKSKRKETTKVVWQKWHFFCCLVINWLHISELKTWTETTLVYKTEQDQTFLMHAKEDIISPRRRERESWSICNRTALHHQLPKHLNLKDLQANFLHHSSVQAPVCAIFFPYARQGFETVTPSQEHACLYIRLQR